MEYLKVEELKPFYTYRIRARNGRVGVWYPDAGDFMLKREKFGDVFVFGETHYDLDDHFGTAMPLEELEQSPFTAEDFKYKTMTWEEAGFKRPEHALTDKVMFRPREKELLDYLQQWEDKMTDPHPREPFVK